MKISVIGGSGFIGTRLVGTLVREGHQIAILDKRESIAYPKLWQRCDVRDSSRLCELTKGSDVIINLAAEHRDDVKPRSLYDEVNVGGARCVVEAARHNGIRKVVFTSSVAVYGFAPAGTDESGALNPFNDYGRTKMEAESVYRAWLAEEPAVRSLTIVRPTVVFGERNRGNVYNLLHQIAGGMFFMVGNGRNRKSMAYVENVAAFLSYVLGFETEEYLFNYIDKPDFDMSSLVAEVRSILGRQAAPKLKIPYLIAFLGAKVFDVVASATGRQFSISSIRVKKFCAETLFSSSRVEAIGFKAPVALDEGIRRTVNYEFLEDHKEDLFFSE
jgi:nucleoside-diphosphate-sugar epimerase